MIGSVKNWGRYVWRRITRPFSTLQVQEMPETYRSFCLHCFEPSVLNAKEIPICPACSRIGGMRATDTAIREKDDFLL